MALFYKGVVFVQKKFLSYCAKHFFVNLGQQVPIEAILIDGKPTNIIK